MKYEESSQTELKQELKDEIKIGIVAYLNTEGRTIYVGVRDGDIPKNAFWKIRYCYYFVKIFL